MHSSFKNLHPFAIRAFHPPAMRAFHPPTMRAFHPFATRAFHPPAMRAFHPFATRAFYPLATRAFGPPAMGAFRPTAVKPWTRLIHNPRKIRTDKPPHPEASPAEHLGANEEAVREDPNATKGDDIKEVGVLLFSTMM